VLGFRLHLSEYPTEYPEYFRIVDLRKGKQIDDGYHAIHLYYQRDNLAYPIEVQLWCADDYQFNIWSHRFIYKYREAETGRKLYEMYKIGDIRTEDEFIKRLIKLEGEENGR